MPNTTNYSWVYPTTGGDENNWGAILTTMFQAQDTTVKTVFDAIPTSIIDSSITDTPNSFSSQNGKFLKVNSGSNAVEFSTASSLELTDTPSSFSGQALKVLQVNSGENALEFVAQNSGGIALNSLSVTTSSASQGGSLNYNNSSGVFTFVPTDYATLLATIAGTRSGATSSELTVTGGQTFSFAHGLSASPFMVQWSIKNITAEHGYSVGDVIIGTDTVANASHSPSIYVESGDTSNVKGVFPSLGTFQIASKASGVVGNTVTTTAGRWKMIVKVMK